MGEGNFVDCRGLCFDLSCRQCGIKNDKWCCQQRHLHGLLSQSFLRKQHIRSSFVARSRDCMQQLSLFHSKRWISCFRHFGISNLANNRWNGSVSCWYFSRFVMNIHILVFPRVSRPNNRLKIHTSPSNGSARLSTQFIHSTASMGRSSHLFVRFEERRMHFDGTSIVVRNQGHSAGFDEDNNLRIY